MIVNYVGVRSGANLQNVLTVIKFVGLVGVCAAIFIFGKGNTANFVSGGGAPSGSLLGAFGIALVASLWAYKGWEAATYSGGEMKNPQKTLPWGILIGSIICVVLYVIAQLAYLYVMPAAEIAKSDRIAAQAMEIADRRHRRLDHLLHHPLFHHGRGQPEFRLLAARLLRHGQGRRPVQQAFGRSIPSSSPPMSRLSPSGSGASSSAVFSGTFEQLFTYVVFGQWIFFGLTVAAVIVLRKKRPDLPRPYKTWGYPVTPIIFILASLYIAVNALISQPLNALAGLGLILLGLPVYFLVRGRAKKSLR